MSYMSCEKCWNDAFTLSYGTSKDQADCYRELLDVRASNPCTPKEQAGQFWDDIREVDTRVELK